MNDGETGQGSPPSPPPPHAPLGERMMTGAAWMIGMRWTMRGLGVVSTAIIARILTPEDFGIVAMAMVVVAFVNSFQDFGIDMAIIRLREVREAHYNTAWTLSLLFGMAFGLVMLIGSPWAGDLLGDQRVSNVIVVLSVLPVLTGGSNIRTLNFRRDLNFALEFRYNLISRVLGVAATIVFAVTLRSYWALVLGMLSTTALRAIVGYVLIPVMPRLSFEAASELWSISGWIQLRSVGQTAGRKVDQVLIGRVLGSGQLGGYQVCQDVASLATDEIVMPIGRSLLPGYARIMDDRDRLRRAFEKVAGAYIILTFALGGGLYLVADTLIPVLLGPKWVGFIPIFQILSIASAVGLLGGLAGPLAIALGRARLLAVAGFGQVATALIFVGTVVALGGGLHDIAVARLATACVIAAGFVTMAMRLAGVPLWHLLHLTVRPFIATLLMAYTVMGVTALEPGLSPFVLLPLQVVIGASTFCTAVAVLWLVAGRPDTAEKDLFERLQAMPRPWRARA